MNVIDTNVLASLLLDRYISISAREKDLIQNYRSLSISERLVPTFVLSELSTLCLRVLPYKHSIGDKLHFLAYSNNFINSISKYMTIYFCTEEDFEEAAKIYKKVTKKNPNQRDITFADSMLAAIAKNNSIGVLTNEDKIIKLAAQ